MIFFARAMGKPRIENCGWRRDGRTAGELLYSILHLQSRLYLKLPGDVRYEDIFDLHWPCEKTLLAHVTNKMFEDMTVRFNSVGPPVGTENFSQLLSFPWEPRHCARQRVGDMHIFDGMILGVAKSLVKAASDPGVLVVNVSPHHQNVHDGKDLGSFVVFDLHILIIRKKPSNFGRAFHETGRGARRNERVNFTGFKQ